MINDYHFIVLLIYANILIMIEMMEEKHTH